jgi:hypothetical protein
MTSKLLLMIPVLALLAACGSAPKDAYERRTHEIEKEQRRDREVAIDRMPRWFKTVPQSKDAVYAAGEAEGATINWALTKARHVAYGDICMSAGGKVDSQTKLFRAEIGKQLAENSNSATRSICPGVDITGIEQVAKFEGEDGVIVLPTSQGFRAYVLVALPVGTANRLQERKDRLEAGRQADRQAERAWQDLDRQTGRGQ